MCSFFVTEKNVKFYYSNMIDLPKVYFDTQKEKVNKISYLFSQARETLESGTTHTIKIVTVFSVSSWSVSSRANIFNERIQEVSERRFIK